LPDSCEGRLGLEDSCEGLRLLLIGVCILLPFGLPLLLGLPLELFEGLPLLAPGDFSTDGIFL
jgi:hypothetical protein